MTEALVCHVSINKNCTSTIRDLLQRNYGDSLAEFLIQGRRCAASFEAKTADSADPDIQDAIGWIRARQTSLACVSINIPYGMHRRLSRRVRYFTILREPVDRCVSYWYWAYTNRAMGNLWSRLSAARLDLSDLLTAGVGLQFFNDQTRFITGRPQIHLGQQDLHEAMRVIEQGQIAVGTVASLGEDIPLLARQLGWPDASIGHLNEGDRSRESVLPERTRRAFRTINDIDIRLYDWLVSDYLPRTRRNC